MREFTSMNVDCKWRRKPLSVNPKEGWFICTKLQILALAIAAYQQKFDIEEVFRDFQKGGYNLEETKVSGELVTQHQELK